MIAIFTVLGLLLLGGGAYAIYDGWPYLVLERGFTEVIIGSIASSTGLIMLSLAFVLKQIATLRLSLAGAIAARSEASLPAASPGADDPSLARAAAPAAIGAAAGAVAAGAVAEALAVPEAESAPEPAEAPLPSEDRDLFGALVARNLELEQAPAAEDEPAPASTEPTEPTEPLPDMFDEASPVPEPVEHLPESEPTAPAEDGEEPDAFSALRESLTGHLEEPAREAGRIEPSFAPEPDPFAAAEAWMDRASPRREPWLDAPPPAEEPAPAETAAPPWPPRTEPHVFAAPADEPEAPPAPDVAEEPVAEAAEAGVDEAPEAPPETAAEPAEKAAPAASDEGVIGAYQVGDAHFTLYADGSIRARTPDGEYSFASMDELKVYLASEKSRLGV